MSLDLNKLNTLTVILIIIMITASVFPGSLFIYIFNKKIFLQMDFLKLILLASSIAIPIYFFNIIIATHLYPNKDNDLNLTYYSMLGSLFTTLVFFVPILIGFFFKISIQMAVLIAICVQTLWMILLIGDKLFKKNKKINNG